MKQEIADLGNVGIRIARIRKLFMSRVLQWGTNNARSFPWRETGNPYNILVAEMLLRKTSADQVNHVYKQFLKSFPTLESLACADSNVIHSHIIRLGLDGRSKWMKDVAYDIYRKFGNRIPSNEHQLELAIGFSRPYLLNAIRCFAFGKNVPVFDINVRRILERVFSIDFGADAHKAKRSWEIASLLVPDDSPKQYNWAMLDLGRSVCTAKRPKCRICPLNDICEFALQAILEQNSSTHDNTIS